MNSRRSDDAARLAADLRGLGVREGDVVMVHASLRAVGPVEGGADTVIDAIQQAVGPGGTMLMTLGARDDWGWVNERPEPERAGLLRDAEPFDVATTPADPDNGVLAEVFRRRPDTIVNDHPEGRFGAWGSHAHALLDGAPWDHYYGADSPLERFMAAGGRVLRLGADLATVTLIHHAEYLVDLPEKRAVRRHRMVTTPQGVDLRVVECLDDCDGIVEVDGDDYFETILRDYLATGAPAVGTVGNARSELIDGSDIVAFSVGWMAEHLAR